MADWIPWNDYYTIGVPDIDEQHKELFRQFNQVCDAVWEGEGRDAIKGFLVFLANYAQEHFGNEENRMKKHSFPGYEAHRSAHDALVAEVAAFMQKYEAETLGSDVVVKVISDLGTWTRQHIRAMDQELGKFLQSRE
jgi:hemerythrin-like metal-binding protein